MAEEGNATWDGFAPDLPLPTQTQSQRAVSHGDLWGPLEVLPIWGRRVMGRDVVFFIDERRDEERSRIPPMDT